MFSLAGNWRGALALALLCAICVSSAAARTGATLPHFKSEAELAAYLKRLQSSRPPPAPPALGAVETTLVSAPPPPSPPAVAPTADRQQSASNSITNNQEQDVDEGDIVKLHGDTLVVLRRGRLFTVSLAGHGMRPVDAINAYPPGVDASDDWYDEMLIAGDRIIVIGYSYQRGGVEISRFRIDGAGNLAFVDAYQLRSNDYYSARNYASRLIGHSLIFYSPRYLAYGNVDPLSALPALRRWTRGGKQGEFERIGDAHEVYLSPGVPDALIQAVHTVTSCDVTAAVLACKATSVFGPDGRTFYVAAHAVYVWLTPYWTGDAARHRASSILYRLPLDGGAPSAIGVRGAPVDQFSFHEEARGGMLDVLVRAGSAGDAMWASERSQGAVALLRLPLDAFGDGMDEAGWSSYRALPMPGEGYAFQNRFVGDYVLYGAGNDWGPPEKGGSVLTVAPVRGGEVARLLLPHAIDRIEAMGGDAVVIGSDRRDVQFSAVTLASAPGLGDRYVLKDASQSETRSHGFFFEPEPGAWRGETAGVLGLPVSRPARAAYRQLFENSAALVFLRFADGKFIPLGELASHPEGAVDDACVASCIDWYGNARPIFVGNRTFALMGYELVEGALARSAIVENGRVNFAPVNAKRR